jgi:hypothetical protein
MSFGRELFVCFFILHTTASRSWHIYKPKSSSPGLKVPADETSHFPRSSAWSQNKPKQSKNKARQDLVEVERTAEKEEVVSADPLLFRPLLAICFFSPVLMLRWTNFSRGRFSSGYRGV